MLDFRRACVVALATCTAVGAIRLPSADATTGISAAARPGVSRPKIAGKGISRDTAHRLKASAPIAAKPYDFNGDGYPDVALGSPYGTVSSLTSAGFVTVLYSSKSGLGTTGKQVINESVMGSNGKPTAYDHFGYSLVSSDVNADGYADLVIGVPDYGNSTYGDKCGAVVVIYGSSKGLVTSTTATTGKPKTYFEGGGSSAGSLQNYGWSLTAGDFDGQGHGDQVVAASWDGAYDLFSQTDVGKSGAADPASLPRRSRPAAYPPLKVTHYRPPHLAPGKAGDVGAATRVTAGIQLAAGDVTGDHKSDLLYTFHNTAGLGETVVMPGQAITQTDGTVSPALGSPIGDTLPPGGSITGGDFNGDGYTDIAISDYTTSTPGGQVTVYRGSPTGPSVGAAVVLKPGSDGVPGTPTSGSGFGSGLAAADVNGDGYADLAVGISHQTVDGVAAAGQVDVLYGGTEGISGIGSQSLTMNTPGLNQKATANDYFGNQNALSDINGDGYADLLVGAYGRTVSGSDDGLFTVIPGSVNGITTTGSQTFTASNLGVAGVKAQIGLRIDDF
ncbi:FG-GAP-like repeat-containing protein [Actinoallomurus acanthiterrae]